MVPVWKKPNLQVDDSDVTFRHGSVKSQTVACSTTKPSVLEGGSVQAGWSTSEGVPWEWRCWYLLTPGDDAGEQRKELVPLPVPVKGLSDPSLAPPLSLEPCGLSIAA